MRRTVIPILALALVACGKKKSETPPAPSPPPGPVKVAPKAGPPLACDALLPKDVRDKYFPGLTFDAGPTRDAEYGKTMTCNFTKPAAAGQPAETQTVQVICSHADSDIIDQLVTRQKEGMTDVKDVKGIGRFAFAGKIKGQPVVRFRDDDTPCYGGVFGSPTGEDVARVVAANLTPSAFK